MLAYHISCGPGSLQIEAAGDGIDVEHFSGKEEVRAQLALQGMQVDVAEADAAAGNKLLLEGSLQPYSRICHGFRFRPRSCRRTHSFH